jgi:hypothetical protein
MSVGGNVVVVDTGPLVALFDPSDSARERCERALARLRSSRLVTSLAVVTEALYLLGFTIKAQRSLLTLLSAGAVEIADFPSSDLSRASALMERYADLPMDFADATVVVLAERLNTRTVFTLDRRDFGVYRLGRQGFKIVP